MRALDARSRQVKENYIAVREREYMEVYNAKDPTKRAPQYLDFQFYQPTIKTIRNPFLVPQHIPMTTNKEEPTIAKLCEYLSYEEIELVKRLNFSYRRFARTRSTSLVYLITKKTTLSITEKNGLDN